MKMTLREKVLLTILLAVLWSWLSGCSNRVTVPAPGNDEVTVEYLQTAYTAYNDGYFHNKLPLVIITMDEPNDANMASTVCDKSGLDCTIRFNLKYVAAHRVANIILKHEMCHVKTWMKDVDSFGVQIEHGRLWRSCMLELDAAGAWRQDIIDNLYGGNVNGTTGN